MGEERARIEARTSDRIRNSVPRETARAYRGDWRRFVEWCATVGHTPLPTTPDAVAQYATHLADHNLAPSTIERALASILAVHEAANRPKPATKPARMVLREYRAQIAADEHGREVKKAPPATVTKLRAMVATCDPDTLAGVRDRALIVAGFAIGARRSELAALNIRDVKREEQGMRVVIRKSKTDKDAHGRYPTLLPGNHPETCPVRTLQAWLDALAERGVTSGPLFRRIDRYGNLGRSPNGLGDPQGRITGHAVLLIVRRAAKRAGLEHASAFTGHSLRRGFATEAYRAGGDPVWIATQGGWQRGSKTLYGYIADVDAWMDNPLVEAGL